MDKLVGFIRTASYLTFLAALIWAYASLAGQVSYRFDGDGSALQLVDRNTFFFSSVIIFLVANVICVSFIKVLKKIKTSDEGVGIRNKGLKTDIITWVRGFAGILNIMFTTIVFFIGYMNMNELKLDVLSIYLYIGPILLVFWFFYLVKILSVRRN
ncbi:hypothetical protein EV198_0952 [Roseivirga ehrenbergii]|uniref:DNA topoisomerase IV n=1 Tax=Roseivirga ehrenbergii (strain DSM 102268 / JCM 13514 / KCTC 12282 / NCIMB 14502 / KMM 6017) TaxID=279360 RepID=A0A150X7E3_ROSEK|nr:hypothetical protein [Roseivirga ehrenbergii]KYG74572.1 hypothetical protein MB14_05005 [Roseivirga ehrenbergii]TCL14112.1 hypothetical protein EV198_0952 [Roseivirga ehrenbergii]